MIFLRRAASGACASILSAVAGASRVGSLATPGPHPGPGATHPLGWPVLVAPPALCVLHLGLGADDPAHALHQRQGLLLVSHHAVRQQPGALAQPVDVAPLLLHSAGGLRLSCGAGSAGHSVGQPPRLSRSCRCRALSTSCWPLHQQAKSASALDGQAASAACQQKGIALGAVQAAAANLQDSGRD